MGYATPQQLQVTCRRFTEGTTSHQEHLGAQAASSESVSWTKEQERECTLDPELSEEEQWEDALDQELSEEEEWEDKLDVEVSEGEGWDNALDLEVSEGEGWEDTIGTELCHGIGSCSIHHLVKSLGQQDNKGSHPGARDGTAVPTDEATVEIGTWEGPQDKECPPAEEHEGEGSTAIATPAAQEEPSTVGEQAAAVPDPGQAITYTIPLSAFLDALAKETQMSRRKALSILQKALNAAQGKGEQKSQQPTGCQEAVPEPAQSIRAEGLDKEPPVKQSPGQQLPEAEPDLQASMLEATEAGLPVGPAFRSPSPTVIDALAQERRTSIFKSAPRALPQAFTAMRGRGGQEQQQPMACARDLPDTGQSISSELLSKAMTLIPGINQTEEQEWLEHNMDATLAVRAGAAGAVSPAHGLHSPTADGPALLDTALLMTDELLSKGVIVIHGSEDHMEEQRDLEQVTGEGMMVTAPAEGTEGSGHSQRADVPLFLDYSDYGGTEVVKKPVLMVQEPSEYPEEQQEQELNPEDSTRAEGPADRAQSLPALAVMDTETRQRWLKLVSEALRVRSVLRALYPDSITPTMFVTGQANQVDVQDTAEHIRRNVQDKAALGMQVSSQWNGEQQGMELNGYLSSDVTASTVGVERRAHETHSPRTDGLEFLDYYDYIQKGVVKKAVLVVQRPFDKPEEPWEQEPSVDEEMGAKARAAEEEGPAYVPQSPRANGSVLLDTAQYLPAPAEGTERPGHSMHSQTVDAPVFLDYNDYVWTEEVKRAVLMVQKPCEYPEKQQEQEGSKGSQRPCTCPAQPYSP
ncbi:unnamed protein product [Coccothraustes coccothraustes]